MNRMRRCCPSSGHTWTIVTLRLWGLCISALSVLRADYDYGCSETRQSESDGRPTRMHEREPLDLWVGIIRCGNPTFLGSVIYELIAPPSAPKIRFRLGNYLYVQSPCCLNMNRRRCFLHFQPSSFSRNIPFARLLESHNLQTFIGNVLLLPGRMLFVRVYLPLASAPFPSRSLISHARRHGAPTRRVSHLV